MDGDQLIKTIDQAYYQDEKNFNLDHLTDQLPENLTSDYLLEYKAKLERLLAAVTSKVSELVLSHQPAYVDELQRIADLQKSITESIRVCGQGRRCLRFIKDGTAKNGSRVVEHHQRRESLAKLLESLMAISELRKSVIEIRGLIDSQEDFPRAIQMCKQGQALLASFHSYKCVNDLGSRLNDTIELIGEQVDTVLARMCVSYEPDTYQKLHTAYVLMDRNEIAVDQLLMHFCSAINSQAHSIVTKYLAKNSTLNTQDEGTISRENTMSTHNEETGNRIKLKRDFQELCKLLTSSEYLECLAELCKTYWSMMLNYMRILKWHQVEPGVSDNNSDENYRDEPIETLVDDDSSLEKNQETFTRVYIERKLIGGLSRLWYDMKRKLSALILSHDFSGYRFDEFIQVLRVTDLIVRIGDDFCGCSSSDDLISCINTQALNFFNAYHNSSVDELKMFLENELWEIVPVKNDFKLVHLKEFSFLRPANVPTARQPDNSTPELERFFVPAILESGINDTASDTSPFDRVLQANKDTSEDLFGSESQHRDSYFDQPDALPLDRISLSSDSDLDSELAREFVDEDESITATTPAITTATGFRLTKTSGPVLTNSSLNVLRLAGRYVQMMNVLSPISFEILMKVYKLLDHYTAFVYEKFGPDNNDKKLSAVISSLRESLIGSNQSTIEDAGGLIVSQPTKTDEPVNSKKAVAIESLIFLVNQLWNLQEYLESLISAEQRAQLREQFSQNYSTIPDFLKARAEIRPDKR